MRMVEPSLRALTTTPSMAPSSTEVTLPMSAESAASAACKPPNAKQTTSAVVVVNAKRVIASSLSISLLQAPVGDLDPAREPDVGMALGVGNELIHDLGPIRHAGDEGMQVHCPVFRGAPPAFEVQVVEVVLHDL